MVTADQVRNATLASGITYIPSHPCSICGYVVGYYVRDGQLFFDSGCSCVFNPNSCQQRPWEDAAAWINMQTDETIRAEIAKAFGL